MSADEPIIAAYKITDTRTDRFYVGSTNNLERRLRDHRTRLVSGRHPNPNLQQGFTDWSNIEIEYIRVDTEEKSKILEQSMIRFNTNDPNCANIGTGSVVLWGDGMPEEVREKIGRAHRGRVASDETRRKLSEIALNRPPMSAETKQKISKAFAGIPFTDVHKQRIKEAAQKAVVINGVEYPSIQDASAALSLSRPTVRKRLNDDAFPDWKFV